MTSVPAIVLVRTTSTRLPKKCLLPLGNYTVIEHVIQRLQHFGFMPIVATSIVPEDDELETLCNKTQTPFFRGDLSNKIKRIVDAATHFDIHDLLLVDADDPFFDPEANKQSFSYLSHGYDVVLPPSNYYCGSVGYSIKRSVLERAMTTYNTQHSEMLESYILNLDDISTKHLKAPIKNLDHIRLTLDYQEDYELIKQLVDLCGHYATTDDIMNVFKQKPELLELNGFRQQEWKANQDAIKANEQASRKLS